MEGTRRKTQIADRRQRVAVLYLRGAYQTDIAAELGVDQATISRDLTELRKEWLDRSVNHIEQKKAEELAKIDRLELTYWEAWERSKEDAESTTLEKLGALKDEGGKIVGSRVKEVKKREGQSGNPAFLRGVEWCINKRCEILGLDAPKKTDWTSGGEPVKIIVEYANVNPNTS